MLLSKSSCKQLPEPVYKVNEFSPSVALNLHLLWLESEKNFTNTQHRPTYQSILSLYQKSISESSTAYIDNIFVNSPTTTKRKRFCISNEAFYYLWLGFLWHGSDYFSWS